MSHPFLIRAAWCSAVLSVLYAARVRAEEPTTGPMRWPIVLAPDDVPAFPPPPAGFDQPRPGIPHGKLQLVQYASTTVGTVRRLLVYTPPGYDPAKSNDTLYLLHGIGGDETEWQRYCAPGPILDNLYADGKLQPMVVVFPNGRAQKDDRAQGNIFLYQHAFEVFTGDLLNDIVPYVESHYAVRRDPLHRALGGFSMGGGQTLNITMGHPGLFDWIGAFSSAPNTKPPAELFRQPRTADDLKLFYLSAGDQDGLLAVSQGVHRSLLEHHIPHVWNVNHGGHNGETWKLDLYHFAPLLFR